MKLATGLTFDDVLLIPRKSKVLPHEVDVSTQLTNRLNLKIPILSAAMDTVTEGNLAIALAQQGGAGVIHRNLSFKEQAEEVKKVKRFEAGIIKDPITLTKKEPLKYALEVMEKKNISGIPIVKPETNELEGIITIRDLQFKEELQKPIQEMMTPKENLITASPDISFQEAQRKMGQHRIEKLPLVDDDFRLQGLITMKDIKKATKFPNACKDERGRLIVGAAVGTDLEMRREKLLLEAEVDFLVVDTAHGHSTKVLEKTKKLKDLTEGSNVEIIAGNVATSKATHDLIKAGADAIKVGVGPSAICTTRVVAGIGVPQLTAIQSCVEEAKKHDIPTIADGGIRFSGDIVKTLAAGANVVMIGSLFAGTDEAPGELFTLRGESYKAYRGMGSLAAMRKGASDRYAWSEGDKPIAEGVEGRVKYKGKLADVTYQLVGGLKAGMGYTGACNLKNLREKARFIKVTQAGLLESHPHDVQITKEAPNYRKFE